MAVEQYTPDPVAGAATDALGTIGRFNDQEPVRSLLANYPDEQIIDWVAYLKAKFVTDIQNVMTYILSTDELDGADPGPLIMNAAKRYWYIKTPTTSGTVDVEIDETEVTPTQGAEITLAIYGMPAGVTYRYVRPGGLVLFEVPGPSAYAMMTAIYLDSSWRYRAHTSDISITVTSP